MGLRPPVFKTGALAVLPTLPNPSPNYTVPTTDATGGRKMECLAILIILPAPDPNTATASSRGLSEVDHPP